MRTAVREARCPPPPGAGHAPGSSDPVTDLLCQVNDILPALRGNGPSPQSCLFFLNSQTQAAQEWAVYGLCAHPRRQAIRNAELHVPRAQTQGGASAGVSPPGLETPEGLPVPPVHCTVSLHFLFSKAASWTPGDCGGSRRPSLGARLHWGRGQPAAAPQAMAICPGWEGVARSGGEDRSGPTVLVPGVQHGLANVQPRRELRTI